MKAKWLLGDAVGVLSYMLGPKALAPLTRTQFLRLTHVIAQLRMSSQQAEQLAELQALFPERPASFYLNIQKESARQRVLNELEVLRYPLLNSHNIHEICDVLGQNHLDAALQKGRGAILMIGHFGANQMIMPALGHRGYVIHQLSAPPTVWADILPERANPLWRRKLELRWKLEQSLPVQHINVFKFLRPAFACLKANAVLGLAFDGGGGTEWLNIPFLGRQMNLSAQSFQLWQKTKTTLLPTVVLRQSEQQRHQIIISPPLEWEDAPKPILHNATRFVERFSGWVQQFPCHYLPFLQMRRQVRMTDVQPFFDDYPEHPEALSPEAAQQRLREAGQQT